MVKQVDFLVQLMCVTSKNETNTYVIFIIFWMLQVLTKLLLFGFLEFCKMIDKSHPQKESVQEFSETQDNLHF